MTIEQDYATRALIARELTRVGVLTPDPIIFAGDMALPSVIARIDVGRYLRLNAHHREHPPASVFRWSWDWAYAPEWCGSWRVVRRLHEDPVHWEVKDFPPDHAPGFDGEPTLITKAMVSCACGFIDDQPMMADRSVGSLVFDALRGPTSHDVNWVGSHIDEPLF